jgi:hypothetical protein
MAFRRSFSNAELIEKLKLELEVLEKGGYAPSVREPRLVQRVFLDSVSCPNLGLASKTEPCGSCYLMDFVPWPDRDKENPCHYIPLNTRGDTVASLSEKGDTDALYSALRRWLQATMFRLAEELQPSVGRGGLAISLEAHHCGPVFSPED